MIYIILAIIMLIFIYILYLKNKFITLDNLNKEAWSNLKINLQKRLNLIPDIVEAVKEYEFFEEENLNSLMESRTKLMHIDMGNIENIDEIIKENKKITNLLKCIKLDKNLKKQLKIIENEILLVSNHYNGTTRNINIFVKKFPASIFSIILKFRNADLFEF